MPACRIKTHARAGLIRRVGVCSISFVAGVSRWLAIGYPARIALLSAGAPHCLLLGVGRLLIVLPAGSCLLP